MLFCLFVCFYTCGNLTFEKDNWNMVTFQKLENFIRLSFIFATEVEKGYKSCGVATEEEKG